LHFIFKTVFSAIYVELNTATVTTT